MTVEHWPQKRQTPQFHIDLISRNVHCAVTLYNTESSCRLVCVTLSWSDIHTVDIEESAQKTWQQQSNVTENVSTMLSCSSGQGRLTLCFTEH